METDQCISFRNISRGIDSTVAQLYHVFIISGQSLSLTDRLLSHIHKQRTMRTPI